MPMIPDLIFHIEPRPALQNAGLFYNSTAALRP
jgi:hypothetical protein